MQEKFIESLDKAASMLKTADHMLYITYPLIREKRLLLKILTEVYLVVLNIINAILQYDYLYKRVTLYKDSKTNFLIFKQRSAPYFKITPEEIMKIEEIFNLAEKHKESPFEFVRNDKIVIMSSALKTETVTIEKMKGFVITAKSLLHKAEATIKYGV